MDMLLSRYRNITVLLLVIFAQLVLLAYQVKNNKDVRIIRLWAVTAVTPVARVVEGARSNVADFLGDYVFLKDAREQNRQLKQELGKVKLENQFLRNELSTADRAQALLKFQAHTPSKTIAARVIGTGASANSKVVFLDRGSTAGVEKGMAVITPDGIVGKILASYPTASEVLLVTDPSFAAGVISQKHHVRGTLKGAGYGRCRVDYVQNEEKVEIGEWFYTSGEDRVFPKGTPVGKISSMHAGSQMQEIDVDPAALLGGVEEVLIVLDAVHQPIPDVQVAGGGVYLAPPVPGEAKTEQIPPSTGTEADRLREHYQKLGDAQGHKFGEGLPGSKPPDFNMKLPPDGATAPGAATPAGGAPAAARPADSAPSAGQPAQRPPAAQPRPGTEVPQAAPPSARPTSPAKTAPPRTTNPAPPQTP